jgi:hypothetical protein
MVTVLEALYLLTTISAVITLVLMWRERRSTRRGTVRLAARHWAGITVALAVLCVALYWYLGSR